MPDIVIEAADVNDLPLVVELFNQIFRPVRSIEMFQRRFLGRQNVLLLLAKLSGKPVGFFMGYELKPDTFYAYFYGVLPDARRMGAGATLMEAAQKWAKERGYEGIRLECYNQQRPMLHLAIELGYDIVGIRWDADRGGNLVLFEKQLKS
jgi:ribosomal protein S18 acetylase RimI-like enzyme